MTRVDFYLAKDPAPGGKQRLACRLADKAYRGGHRVFIHTADAAESARLDELLWTFGQSSFVPHRVLRPGDDPGRDEPVVIGEGDPPAGFDDVLISLSGRVPAFFSRFERALEPVSGDPEDRKLARERFRFYRDRGYPLDTHEIRR